MTYSVLVCGFPRQQIDGLGHTLLHVVLHFLGMGKKHKIKHE